MYENAAPDLAQVRTLAVQSFVTFDDSAGVALVAGSALLILIGQP